MCTKNNTTCSDENCLDATQKRPLVSYQKCDEFDKAILDSIKAKPQKTRGGKPFDHVVRRKVASGEYRLQCIPPEVTGTARPIEVYRARRAKNNIIKPWESKTNDESYCPAHWADIAIGRGPCGYRCRACFLILTHRTFCDPSRHVLYDNVYEYENAVKKELNQQGPNLGLGIDCSDSLLYEGVTGHARRIIPLFSNKQTNPFNRKLILLTKSANVDYLKDLPTTNILMTFSLNPEPIADMWEGKWSDGLRITPHINDRLEASMKTQMMGFEVRWRIDPILPIPDWRHIYKEFFFFAASASQLPSRITLGTYREMGRSLLTMAANWGLPKVEFKINTLTKDGMHYHIPSEQRIEIYQYLKTIIESAWQIIGKIPAIALCKESKEVRLATDICHDHCNCE